MPLKLLDSLPVALCLAQATATAVLSQNVGRKVRRIVVKVAATVGDSVQHLAPSLLFTLWGGALLAYLESGGRVDGTDERVLELEGLEVVVAELKHGPEDP